MPTSYGTGDRAKATKLHSQLVRLRAEGCCQRCGKHVGYGGLQAAHIIRRTFAATRTDERNAWATCPRCHFHLDQNPDEFMAFVAQWPGMAVFAELKAKAREGVGRKVDWPAEVDRLRLLVRELEAAA